MRQIASPGPILKKFSDLPRGLHPFNAGLPDATFIWQLATQKSQENTVCKTLRSKHFCLWWSILLKIFEFIYHLICVSKQSIQDFFQARQNTCNLAVGSFAISGAIVATYSTLIFSNTKQMNAVCKTLMSKHFCLWWSILLKIFEFIYHLICVSKQSIQVFFQPRENTCNLAAGSFAISGAIVATYSTLIFSNTKQKPHKCAPLPPFVSDYLVYFCKTF